MEEGADWGMKREEANNRREVGRGRRRKEKQRKMTGRLGTCQLIIKATVTRDSHRKNMQ